MNKVILLSCANFPIRVKYGASTITIPPLGVAKDIDEALIESLPSNVQVLRHSTFKIVPVKQIKKDTPKKQKEKQ